MSTPVRPRARWLGLPVMLVLVVAATLVFGSSRRSSPPPAFTLSLDPGTPLSGQAPDFTLVDQFGARVSLHSFRGRVVILAFNDSECTTICPLTTTAMVAAQRLLGQAGSRVALLGVDANPTAISIGDVRTYSELHGMVHAWHFLTGGLPELKLVWTEYPVAVAIEHGQVDHTPALFMITPTGQFDKVYLTQMSYASVGQQAQLLAREASSLLPGHPRVHSRLSYAQIPVIYPRARVALPRAGGGAVQLGPGSPRLLVFFATWDTQVTDLAAQLDLLGRYEATAAARGLPKLVAVDEASVEPAPAAFPRFLGTLDRPLSYPVAIDSTGRVADGYGVQDEPWFVLVSATGRILWYHDISTSGWLATRALVQEVRGALTRPNQPSGALQTQAELAGSPPPLNALHREAGQLLGGQSALLARLRALRGYPVVVNAWASWCGPCRAEFALLASASARYGREVAFVGVDTSDSAGDARGFLAQHPVSYPSYQSPNAGSLSSLAVIEGLPTTVFVNSAGHVAYVHAGQYDSQGALDQDINAHANGS